MITYHYRTIKDGKLQTFDTIRPGIWAHAESPTEEEIIKAAQDFGLDELVLRDSQDYFEVPRFERSSGGSYFFVRYPFETETGEVSTAPLLIVMGESFVLTMAQQNTPFLKPFFDGSKEAITTQKTKLFLQLMGALTANYERELTRMHKAVHRDRVRLHDIKAKDVENLVQYEQTLNDIVSALIPTNAWLEQVLSGNVLQLFTDDVPLYQDLMIANRQVVDSSKAILKTIQNIRSAYEVLLSNALNITIRRLTALTILLTIPTIVASLFGMNVAIPLENHPYAFWLIIVLVVTLVLLVWHSFARNKWL